VLFLFFPRRDGARLHRCGRYHASCLIEWKNTCLDHGLVFACPMCRTRLTPQFDVLPEGGRFRQRRHGVDFGSGRPGVDFDVHPLDRFFRSAEGFENDEDDNPLARDPLAHITLGSTPRTRNPTRRRIVNLLTAVRDALYV
jgi:hypothetical protein